IRTTSARNAASARGERQILPRQTNSTAGFRGTSCDPPLSLSDTIFPTLAHGMGNVPRSKRRCSVPELLLIGSGRALFVAGIASGLLLSLAPDEPATKGYA